METRASQILNRRRRARALLRADVAVTFLALYFTTIHSAMGQVFVWGDASYGQTNVPPRATNVIALAAGDNHCVALRRDGTVVAWGSNSSGQTNVPADLSDVVSIAAGSTHSLALRTDGTVQMWGHFYATINSSIPPSATNIVALALGPGATHALILRGDGTVLDWGGAYLDSEALLTNIPPNARGIVSVASGSFHAAALRSDGKVVVWGDNSKGQCNVPNNATNIVAIACGWFDVVAIRSDGTALAWGSISSPPPTSGFTNLMDVVCPFNFFMSSSSVLGLKRDGTVVQWSQSLPKYLTNTFSAIGAGGQNGLASVASGPPAFPGMRVDRTVAGGLRAYFRMNAVGALPMFYQWSCNGTNIPGATNSSLVVTNVQPQQSGSHYTLTASNSLNTATSGAMTLNVVPLEVTVLPLSIETVLGAPVTLTASLVGQPPFSIQWLLNGTNVLGGTNTSLTLTNAHLSDTGGYSVAVSNQYGVVTSYVAQVTVTPTIITNALLDQGTFLGATKVLNLGLLAMIPVSYQWYFNGSPLLGATNASLTVTNARYDQSGTYSLVFSNGYEVATNSARLSVGNVAAWGYNWAGQTDVALDLTNIVQISGGANQSLALRNNGTVSAWGDSSSTNVPAGLTNVIAVSAGSWGNVALRSDGTIVAWGSPVFSHTNVPVSATNVVAVSAGGYFNLALRADGTVIPWGQNDSGQTNLPVDLTNIVAISAGSSHSVALRADGTVLAWGNNNNGQTNVPVDLSNVVGVAAGYANSVAIKNDGTVVVWGNNNYGQLTVPTALTNVVAISGGYGDVMALGKQGSVFAWGNSNDGRLQIPIESQTVSMISCGQDHNLALVGNGLPLMQASQTAMRESNGTVTVSVPSQCGRVYRLEYAESLLNPIWTALPLVAGTGTTIKLTDPSATNSVQRFYRVRQW